MANIQSITRAFEILRAVANQSEGRPLADIARVVDLPKSTVSRMLSTLEMVGAVERVAQPDGFRIGAGIVALAAQVAYPRTLIAIAHPYLQDLAQAAGETVSLGVPDGDQVYYIDQVDSWRNLRLKDWTGHRLPLYATSDGKLYLAHMPAEALEHYLSHPLHPHSEHTITDPEKLHQELAQVRRQGYAWNHREFDPDIVSLAAPIWDGDGQLVASVCMFGPFFRFPPAEQCEEVVQLTLTAAQKISHRLQSLTGRMNENGLAPTMLTGAPVAGAAGK
jgi:DNA-binding IclR family transcriptional regulator